MTMTPCKDCPARHPVCHDTCPKYAEFKCQRGAEAAYTREMLDTGKVYSPAIENAGYASRRRPKYTITVDTFSDLVPTDTYSRERDYQLLQIPLGGGRFELVSTSLVEIEYY